MKIVGFRLSLRPKEIQRRARKAGLDLVSLGLDEAALQELLAEVGRALRPAVLFSTFPNNDPDQALLSPMPGLAYSLVLSTLGPGFDALRAGLEAKQPPLDALWPHLRDAGLEEGRRFATRLLEDEAGKDSCDLSPLSALTEPSALRAALSKLEASKIGVSLAGAGLAPEGSEAFSVGWIARSKSRGRSR